MTDDSLQPCPGRVLRRRPARRRPHARRHEEARRAAAPGARRHDAGRPSARRRRSPTSAASPSGRFPRSSTSRRSRSSAGRSPHDPFFSVLRRRRTTSSDRGAASRTASAPASSSAATATSSPTTTSSPASRAARDDRAARRDRRARRQARDAAQVVGVDPATDLALLKIDATDLPTMPWGDSSKLKVAEWVLAIGNPYQLNQTVTLGIVSALGRDQPRRLDLRGLHPDRRGDQPGQLRRRAGQRARRAGRHQHRDLQPERRLSGHRLRRVEQPRRRVVNDLQQYGEVRRGSIGCCRSGRAADDANRQRAEAPGHEGRVIYEMLRNSSAFKAGLEPATSSSLQRHAGRGPGTLLAPGVRRAIGSTATIGVIREGRRIELKVTIAPPRQSSRHGAACRRTGPS